MKRVALVVTTYGSETYLTQKCLGRIRKWKGAEHELIVVVHDESPLLAAFLQLCVTIGLVDKLLWAAPAHGHLRGANLGFEHADAPVVFNVCNDVMVGERIVAECTALLDSERTGMVGWQYDWSSGFEGTRWRDGGLEHSLRKPDFDAAPGLIPEALDKSVQAAHWATGLVFDAIGRRRFLCVNGSFFAIRKELWVRLGGFDELSFEHDYADDLLTYAVLDQGLDVLNVPAAYRCNAAPEEFFVLENLRRKVGDHPYAGLDRLDWPLREPIGGLGHDESVLLSVLDRAIGSHGSVITRGEIPWTPQARQVEQGPADLILQSHARFDPALGRDLKDGGWMIAFDVPAHAVGSYDAAVGSLGITRRTDARTSFVRRNSCDPKQ